MKYDDDINYKYVDNHDDGDNPPNRLGCAPFIIGFIVIIFICLAARSCGESMSNPFSRSCDYEYGI